MLALPKETANLAFKVISIYLRMQYLILDEITVH
jgi:hypothetical protein